MARLATNIRGGFDGHIYVGLAGATAPVNPSVAWDVDEFDEMGWISDDGVSGARGRDTNEVFAMGATNAPVWSRITSQESTLEVTLMETTAKVAALFYGQSTGAMTSTAAAGGVPQFLTMIEQAITSPTEYALGIDLTDGTFLYRRYYPRVTVTETGDLNWNSNDPLLYPITFKAMIGSDGTIGKHMWSGLALPSPAFPLVPA
jgi:hypothetical protein